MATAVQQRKLKTLFEQSMAIGGLPAFRTEWGKSIGLHRDGNERQVFDPKRREVNGSEFSPAEVCAALMGQNWRNSFAMTCLSKASLDIPANPDGQMNLWKLFPKPSTKLKESSASCGSNVLPMCPV